LNPEDVPRLEDGPMPSDRITLQHLVPPTTGLIQPLDAVFKGEHQPRDGNAPPPALLLDFMYGAAAYKRWGNGSEMECVIHDKFVDEYQSIPILQRLVEPSSDEDSGSERDDPTDGDYVDPGFAFGSDGAHSPSKDHNPNSVDLALIFQSSHTHPHSKPHDPNYDDPGLAFQSNRAHSLSKDHDADSVVPGLAFHSNCTRSLQDPMIKAMDDMNALMMHMNGVTPEARAAQWQKEEEERQLKEKEFSQSKVLEWMK
jgi:hypothetical protein